MAENQTNSDYWSLAPNAPVASVILDDLPRTYHLRDAEMLSGVTL